MRRLESYDWPGNVRELENTIERAVALESERRVSMGVLPAKVAGYSPELTGGKDGSILIPAGGIDFEAQMAEFERRNLVAALQSAGGVRTRAAQLLKISYRSFRHYAKKHNV